MRLIKPVGLFSNVNQAPVCVSNTHQLFLSKHVDIETVVHVVLFQSSLSILAVKSVYGLSAASNYCFNIMCAETMMFVVTVITGQLQYVCIMLYFNYTID